MQLFSSNVSMTAFSLSFNGTWKRIFFLGLFSWPPLEQQLWTQLWLPHLPVPLLWGLIFLRE